MKKILLIIIAITFLNSCQSQNYEIENILYECQKNFYNQENKNLDNDLKDFEKYLLDNKILKSNDGQGYYDCLKKIKNNDEKIINLDLDKFKNLNSLYNDNWLDVKCIENITSIEPLKWKNSKFNILLQEFNQQGFIIKILKFKLESMTKILNSSDFENYFYKSFFLEIIFEIKNIKQ